MKRTTKMVAVIGAALSLGLAAAAVNAHPSGMGWGGGPGYGMHGNGMGYGPGPGYGMHGNGMGYGPGGGYGMHGYGPGPGYGMHGYGMGGGRGAGYGMHGYLGNSEQGLAQLKSELGIGAKQESAWQAFVDNSVQREKNREAWFAKLRDARAAATTPELFAQRAEIMKQRQGELEATAAAVKNLYSVLTPEQQAIADRSLGGFGPGYGRAYGYRGGPGARSR